MRVIAKRTLKGFWESHPDSEQALLDWYDVVSKQEWKSPHDVKALFSNASIIDSSRVIFNIKGNDYRLITHIDYTFQIIFVIWLGRHSDYDKVDARTVSFKKRHER